MPTSLIAETQLRAINHRFVNALATAEGDFIDRMTAADFMLMDALGNWIDRARHLDRMRAPSLGGVSYDDVRVRLFGPTALLHGVFESDGDTGPAVRVRYTHAYHRSSEGWRLVHGQNTALQPGVAKQQHHGRPPVLASWQGTDPMGAEAEVLRELNASYVRAYREADVVWYDAHLSHDYVVVNGDGSFHDRARALNKFAENSFAQHMRSFPVDKVRIRRFGDMALIDAENAYERKDGLKGVSRYTDIWHKVEDGQEVGRWCCVAAHITTHRAAG